MASFGVGPTTHQLYLPRHRSGANRPASVSAGENIVHKAVVFSQVVADKNTVGSAASASYFSPSTDLTSAHSVGMACHLAVAGRLTLTIGEGWADSGSE